MVPTVSLVSAPLRRPLTRCYCSCHAVPEAEFVKGPPRFREHDDALQDTYVAQDLWDVFGINNDVQVS